MAYESLVPGHVLTEEDVIRVLRQGETGARWLAEQVRECAPSGVSYEELIESVSLRNDMEDTIPGSGGGTGDPVYYAWRSAGNMLREEAAFYMRQRQNRIYASMIVGRIWSSLKNLEPEMQEVLRRFYVDRECVEDIAGHLRISQTTFWRRRRKAVRLILQECGEDRPSQTMC